MGSSAAPAGGVSADQALDMHMTIHSMTSQRDTPTVQLLEANSTILRLDKSLRNAPTQSTVQAMLNEANASSINVTRQRDALVQQLHGAETRIAELVRFLLNMQTMAAHVNAKFNETDRLRQEATHDNDALRTELTRLTQRVAELTRETADRYTPGQLEEARRQTVHDNEVKLTALRAEMQNLVNTSDAELKRYKGMYTKVQQEQMATAINTDAASSQAQFIRQLREKCEILANERDTYRRNAEDYATQLSRADETCQQQAAEHYDHMAAARHESNGLKSQIIASTDVNKQQATENVGLTSNVAQLRGDIQSQNAMVETMNRNAEEESKRNEEVKQGLRNAADEAARQLNARPDPAAQKKQSDRHAHEVATLQTKYDHYVVQMDVALGDLQAENTSLSDDITWYQDRYQEEEESEHNENAYAHDEQGTPSADYPRHSYEAGGSVRWVRVECCTHQDSAGRTDRPRTHRPRGGCVATWQTCSWEGDGRKQNPNPQGA